MGFDDVLLDLESADSSVRDLARAQLLSLRETRQWEAVFRAAAERREQTGRPLSPSAAAMLRQECLDFQRRERPDPTQWVTLAARLLTEPSPVSEHKRSVQDFVATILDGDRVPRSARREFVELVLARGGKRAECGPLIRLVARVSRSLAIREARPHLRDILLSSPFESQPEVLIDVLQAIASVGRSEDIASVGLHLDSTSPGVAQSAVDAIIQLSGDVYALRTLVFERSSHDGGAVDRVRSALARSRFTLPQWIVRRALAAVLRFERGPRARASLTDVIARDGGAIAVRVLARQVVATQDRAERDRIRSALASVQAPPRAWSNATRSADPEVQALAWSRRQDFAAIRRQWPRMNDFLKLCLLESARDLADAKSRQFLEHVYATEQGVMRLKAAQAMAARADAATGTLIERMRRDGKEYGRSEILIELAENIRKADTSEDARALGEFCGELSSMGPGLAYAKVRAALRLRDPQLTARVAASVGSFSGCLRERCVELLSDAILQETLRLSALDDATLDGGAMPALWGEALARLRQTELADSHWEDLLIAARRSAVVRSFVAGRDAFWRVGLRSVVRGFMNRERWRELRQSVAAFDGHVDAGLLAQARDEMDRREEGA